MAEGAFANVVSFRKFRGTEMSGSTSEANLPLFPLSIRARQTTGLEKHEHLKKPAIKC